MAKKRGFWFWVGKVLKWLGIALLIGLVVAVICYFAVPDFKTYVNNTWEDLKFQIDNNKEAVKLLLFKQ